MVAARRTAGFEPSAPLPEGAVHLVEVDDALGKQYRCRTYLTVCGRLLPVSSLPAASCPPECTSKHPYCPECVREAARFNAELATP